METVIKVEYQIGQTFDGPIIVTHYLSVTKATKGYEPSNKLKKL